MRKIIAILHISIDGYVAGPKGEMNWVHVDDEIFSFGKQWTDQADAALYGKNTFHMMDAYWPTAADKPNASQHDIDHAQWYKRVTKYVASTSLTVNAEKTEVFSNNVSQQIAQLKNTSGENIVIYGSPQLIRTLNAEALIDEYVLFMNPVLLGAGTALFQGIGERTPLALKTTHVFTSGVVCLHYQRV